ncbi:MAG TPA: ribosome small subunit-dependent GTPase A [Clostridiales bacterium]|jgi:ribosome biogenesis GTPase / thiamine phosphate phosphatase|nr:ribosome small subunit-dependent GTPase A [Clostridiales bacterium]HQP69441.1 ribosome small subunit-dependent GTPase A [Clostridiales bacterium]
MNKALVLYGNGTDYTVSLDGKECVAHLKGTLLHTTKRSHHPVCPGDYVRIEQEGSELVMAEILPRMNRISRPANYGMRKEQVIASNIDHLLLVSSVFSPRMNTGFLDRILAYSNMQRIETEIVVNKTDYGISDEEQYYIEGYRQIGYEVIETSVEKSINIDKISCLTSGSVSALIGNSGVGKSSILNAIDPAFRRKVNETSSYSLKGKHTTKQARLYPLSNGGFVLDTPGIREFGMWNMDFEELKNFFPEIYKLSSQCRYHNCLHTNEPGCAVIAAADEGKIPEFRYENYLKIFQTLYDNRHLYFKKDK